MKRWLVLALVAGCSSRSAPPAPAAASADPSPPAGDRPLLLWKVERDQSYSYLLGTCHLPIPLDHALPEPHRASLDGARVLYTELRMGDLGGMDALGSMWSDEPLSTKLHPEAWLAVSRSLRKAMPASALNRMPAWAAYSLVSTFKDQDLFAKLNEQMAGSGDPKAVPVLDVAVEQAAAAKSIEHRALETADEQFAVLQEHDGDFLEALQNIHLGGEDEAEESAAMARACFQGDIAALEDVVASEEDTDMMAALLDDRNARWIENLGPELAQGGVLVAAGAAHMVGDSGLIAAFEREGYAVTPQIGPASSWDPPALELGGVGLEVAQVDDGVIDAYLAGLGGLVSGVCAPTGMVAQCMIPDTDACAERIEADLTLCIEQLAPDLPADPAELGMEHQLALQGCAAAGVTLESLVTDSLGDAPVCQMMKAAMQQAQQTLGGP